eukprot:gene5767-4118_t
MHPRIASPLAFCVLNASSFSTPVLSAPPRLLVSDLTLGTLGCSRF